MAYVLKINEARRHDAYMLAAAVARGVEDVNAVADDLASDGAEARFERALDQADLPEMPEDENALEATIISMQAFVNQVNSGMS